MLAQNFMAATDLGIADHEREALVQVLGLLERGELRRVPQPDDDTGEPSFCGLFNMAVWNETGACGTVACIGGTAELIGGFEFEYPFFGRALRELFYPPSHLMDDITTGQAAMALRNYLSFGEARWDEVLVNQ